VGSTTRGKGAGLSTNDQCVTFEGKVIELLRGGIFRVLIEDQNHVIIARLNGKMRMHNIKVLLGDKVDCDVSPYDLSQGRITRRR
jgi:translation initiation factor IF-1